LKNTLTEPQRNILDREIKILKDIKDDISSLTASNEDIELIQKSLLQLEVIILFTPFP
jgi:hypothetical protein